MLKFLFPFRKNAPHDETHTLTVANSTIAIATSKELTPDNQVIAISNAEHVDEFVDVDLRNLSYAEVAALTATDVVNGNSPCGSPRIVEQQDLENEIGDIQMSKTLRRRDPPQNYEHYEPASGVIRPLDMEVEAYTEDTFFNDKGNRRLKKGLRRKKKFEK